MREWTVLWADLRRIKPGNGVLSDLMGRYAVTVVNDASRVAQTIRETHPSLSCFDYDSPDSYRLAALKDTKSRFPALPILMLTDEHSEALAVWAFRSRVWDYLVKPFPTSDLTARIDTLEKLVRSNAAPMSRQLHLLTQGLPIEYRVSPSRPTPTLPAINYIGAHLHEPIRIEAVATLCGMGVSTFCRAFKRMFPGAFL